MIYTIITVVLAVLIYRALQDKKSDIMADGYGEFGLEPTNPIPTSSIPHSYFYLDRLRTKNGSKITYDRMGSVSSANIGNLIDEYSISLDGKELTSIYICPYNEVTSTKAPKGFKLC